MTTTSIAVANKWSDQQHLEINGTIAQWFNIGWLAFNARVGVLDLKAPRRPGVERREPWRRCHP